MNSFHGNERDDRFQQSLKVSLQTSVQISTLLSLMLQLHGLAITFKILEMKRNLPAYALFSVKKSKLRRKMKHYQAR